jgi:Pyridoxal-dependent decarboxylase conserved domain
MWHRRPATVGTTSTTSIDPIAEIAPICRDYGLWLHVDGAYGGMAAIVPEMRYVLDGCEGADSIVINPHKWLFTPLDCSALYVRDPGALKRSFSLVPEYLRGHEEGVTNYMDWGICRRFRALKLWMVISYFGHEGLAARISPTHRAGPELGPANRCGRGHRAAGTGAFQHGVLSFPAVRIQRVGGRRASKTSMRRVLGPAQRDGTRCRQRERRGVSVAHQNKGTIRDSTGHRQHWQRSG